MDRNGENGTGAAGLNKNMSRRRFLGATGVGSLSVAAGLIAPGLAAANQDTEKQKATPTPRAVDKLAATHVAEMKATLQVRGTPEVAKKELAEVDRILVENTVAISIDGGDGRYMGTGLVTKCDRETGLMVVLLSRHHLTEDRKKEGRLIDHVNGFSIAQPQLDGRDRKQEIDSEQIMAQVILGADDRDIGILAVRLKDRNLLPKISSLEQDDFNTTFLPNGGGRYSTLGFPFLVNSDAPYWSDMLTPVVGQNGQVEVRRGGTVFTVKQASAGGASGSAVSVDEQVIGIVSGLYSDGTSASGVQVVLLGHTYDNLLSQAYLKLFPET